MGARNLIRGVLAVSTAFSLSAAASVASAAAWDKPGYELTFQDEFDGSSLDLTNWKPRYKWGEAVINGELEAYVDTAFVEQNGILSIVGKHESGQYAGQTLDYTSGVICSLHEQIYGYFEARLKVPKGQGYWPAFWLLGAVGTQGVNEIDIHEILGNDTTTAYMTVHWGTSYDVGHESDGKSFTGPDFSTDFHVFGLQWDPDKIVWSIDGVDRFTHTGAGIPSVNMYIILNLAIGGGWPGAPDATTPFPGYYDIDYVRAYQRSTTDGGSGGSSGSAGSTASGGASAGGSGGTTASGGASSGGTAASDSGTKGGSGGSPASGGKTSKNSSDDAGGCGCRAIAQADSKTSALWLLGLAIAAVRRRRARA